MQHLRGLLERGYSRAVVRVTTLVDGAGVLKCLGARLGERYILRTVVIVSHETLRELMAEGAIVVEPLEPDQLQPASIDLTLGDHFLKVDENTVDRITLDTELRYVELRTEEIVIPPHSFLLAVTRERIKLPHNITAFVEGRSSIGRLGLFIQNAGWVDPGFDGTLTLELFNANRLPIRLRAGRRICQIVFAQLDRSTDRPYRGKYQHQSGAVGSRIHLDRRTPAPDTV